MFAITSRGAKRRLPWGSLALAGAVVVPLALVSGGGSEATYDGRVGRLAFAMDVEGNVDVYSARQDGSGLRQLTTDPGFDACAAYHPSGRQIAFCSDRSGALEIWTMRADGHRQRQLTQLGGSASFPDFSPSGRLVAFGGTRNPDRPSEIWRVRDDGTHLERLTYTPNQTEEFPAWRPGHAQIAFLRPDVPFLGTQLWIMRADGSHQRPLTFDDTVKDQLPDWSPDGRRLAYAADGDIWVMRANGSHQRRLTDSSDEEFGAAWSPDGTRVAFVRDEGDRRPIYTIAADGSDEQVLLPRSTDRQFVPGWQPHQTRPRCTARIRDLGTVPGGLSSEVLAMNGHGLVVGGSTNAGGVERAVIWQRGRIRDLGLRGNALALDVNEQGVVIGTFAVRDGEELSGHVFRWRDGHSRRLPGIGGSAEWARRINERGQIAGSALGAGGRENPVVWQHGRPHNLGIPAGYDGAFASGVNDHGDFVGAAYSDFAAVAWTWTATGGSHPLDRRGSFSVANVIDNQGRAAGGSDFGGNPGAYAALWPGHRNVAPLGVFGQADFSYALATSGKGDFAGIGDYFAGEGVGHAFLRRVVSYQAAKGVSGSRLRTLMPLSGDPADPSNVHAVLRSDPPLARTGSVAAGGHSATVGGEEHATLWTCAYQQSFVPDDQLTSPPRRGAEGRTPNRTQTNIERLLELARG